MAMKARRSSPPPIWRRDLRSSGPVGQGSSYGLQRDRSEDSGGDTVSQVSLAASEVVARRTIDRGAIGLCYVTSDVSSSSRDAAGVERTRTWDVERRSEFQHCDRTRKWRQNTFDQLSTHVADGAELTRVLEAAEVVATEMLDEVAAAELEAEPPEPPEPPAPFCPRQDESEEDWMTTGEP